MPARPGLRHPSVVVNAVLAVLLAAGAFWAYRTISGPATPAAAGAATRTVPVRQGRVTASVTAAGSVASARTAGASFVTGGTVTAIDVHVGQKVTKGQTLAKVDPAAAQRSLAEAQANLTAADDALARARSAGSDTSDPENQVTQARLAVDDARAAVDGTTLTAPMAGTVVAVNGTLGGSSSGSGSATSGTGSAGGGAGNGAGQNSGTGQNPGTGASDSSSAAVSSSSAGFIDLADLSKLQVTANFAEADATKLKDGQAATITWNALSGTAETGTVAAIDPQATTSNNVVTYGVTLALDAVPSGAKPGQTVSVSVVTGAVQNALYVNSAAVTSVGNRHTVTVQADGQQQIVPVEIGLQGDSTTQITSGLRPGQQVAVPLASSTSGSGTGFGPAGGRFGGAGGPFGGGAAPGGGGTFGGGTRTGGGAGPGGGR